MYLVAPDLLTDACGLSLGLVLLALPVGLVLWLLGWWSHRFWVVLCTTVLAGVWGLHTAGNFHTPPLVAAVLLALSAGLLALALVRLVAFAAGGLCGLMLVQAVYPALSQPLITFLVCGLITLLLFRPCVMALTSFAGSLVLVTAALLLLHYNASLDAPAWSEQSATLLNWSTGLLALAGFAGQLLLDRYFFRAKSRSRSWVGEIWSLLSSRGSDSPKPSAARRAA
jgi:hypothetical protein